ncbi:fimbrial protein [Cronobacter muytjensii]|nr:fimbrial protein [Cronobacter muytjensii]
MKLKRTTYGLTGAKGRRWATRAGRARKLLVAALLLVPCGVIPEAAAKAGDQSSMNINITGTVTANGSCEFNPGGSLQVDFGQVRLKATGATTVQLDGNYEQPLAGSFICSGDSAGLLQMKFTSSSGSYETYNGTKVLGTDKGIVGIELMVNGTAQTMDAWFSIDQKNPPALQAKLVQVSTENSKNVVSGDVFTASGSLVMAFN